MQMTRVTQRVRQRSLIPDTESGDGHGADFGGVVDTYEEEIFRYLGRLTGDLGAAGDLFQETFLRVFWRFPRLRPRSNHRAWFYRIATNLFLNDRRHRRRRDEVVLSSQFPSAPLPPVVQSSVHVNVRATPGDSRVAPSPAGRVCPKTTARHDLIGRSARPLECGESAARASVCQAVRRLRCELMTCEEHSNDLS